MIVALFPVDNILILDDATKNITTSAATNTKITTASHLMLLIVEDIDNTTTTITSTTSCIRPTTTTTSHLRPLNVECTTTVTTTTQSPWIAIAATHTDHYCWKVGTNLAKSMVKITSKLQ